MCVIARLKMCSFLHSIPPGSLRTPRSPRTLRSRMRHASTTYVHEIAVAVSRCWLRAALSCASGLLSPCRGGPRVTLGCIPARSCALPRRDALFLGSAHSVPLSAPLSFPAPPCCISAPLCSSNTRTMRSSGPQDTGRRIRRGKRREFEVGDVRMCLGEHYFPSGPGRKPRVIRQRSASGDNLRDSLTLRISQAIMAAVLDLLRIWLRADL